MSEVLEEQLYDFTLEFLENSKGNLIVDGLDWAPDEYEFLSERKISEGARDLAQAVAQELRQLGYSDLDQVLETEPAKYPDISSLALLVLGVMRTAHGGIVGKNTHWR